MGNHRSKARRVATVATVLCCVVALGACSEAKEGNDANPIGMGGAGAVGGASGAGAIGGGGAGGAAGVGGTAGNAGSGGMVPVGGGGAGGMAGIGGTGGVVSGGMGGAGGVAGDVAGGMGGEAGGGMGGTGGAVTGGMGGEAGGGTGGGGGEMMWEDKGMGDGNDVITIGDSWMRLNPTEGVELSLEAASGRNYRNYGVAGTMILDGAIPRQLTRAIGENPNIKTVVMTGGGNDILIGNIFCTVNWADSCNDTVYEVADALAELRVTMAEAGIEDVIIVGYDYIPNEVVKPGLDLSIMLSNEMCKTDEMPRCHFLNNANTVSDKIRGDGIHPTAAGYTLLGERVWAMMQERGLRR